MDRIQIAGIHDLAEARTCLQTGVRQLGFPLGLDVHQEDCTIEEARDICSCLPGEVEKVVISYLDRAVDIAALCRRVGVSIVQLHGNIDLLELTRLKSEKPDLIIIKSLIVKGDNRDALLAAVDRWTPLVDAFITDTYDPITGASGATGKSHDWSVSRALVARSPKPVYLAGGLNPDNITRAIHAVRPWGVDCHTGVEGTDGRKDEKLVRTFVMKAQAALATLDKTSCA